MINSTKQTATSTREVALRFHELAQQEKWFEIQDEFFSENVKSLEPLDSPYLTNAEGKEAVRQKGLDWVARIKEGHQVSTSHPVIAGNHFAVSRTFDITTKDFGRIKIEEIMLYEVKNGQILSEQFFY